MCLPMIHLVSICFCCHLHVLINDTSGLYLFMSSYICAYEWYIWSLSVSVVIYMCLTIIHLFSICLCRHLHVLNNGTSGLYLFMSSFTCLRMIHLVSICLCCHFHVLNNDTSGLYLSMSSFTCVYEWYILSLSVSVVICMCLTMILLVSICLCRHLHVFANYTSGLYLFLLSFACA